MDIASLISYPMTLPEFEKVIPKPPKKRYRDLFEHRESIANIENIPANKRTHGQIIAKDDNSSTARHQGVNPYRKSVIKRSITQHISIEISPFSNTRTINEYDNSVSSSSESTNHRPHLRFLSTQNYLVNSSSMKFRGKLKVKWREEYENLRDDDVNAKNDDTKLSSSLVDQTESNKEPTTNKNLAGYVETSSSQHTTTRKLERTRKGLIYQKFMASTYSKSRRDTSTSNDQQPKKRGRPRTKMTKSEECADNDAKRSSNASITLMRLEDAESEGLKYTMKKSSSTEPKNSQSDCRLCGGSIRVENKLSAAKLNPATCRCYITAGTNDFEIIIDELPASPPIPIKRRRKTKRKNCRKR